MTFENFTRLTGSELLNTPAINAFTKIETDVKKIKIGDLFIGDDEAEIALALAHGAYGILSQVVQKITDAEVAWFYTTSIETTLIRLLKFTLLHKQFRFIYVTPVAHELIYHIADKSGLEFLTADEKENYKKIINADEKTLFFSFNQKLLSQIYPDFETLPALHAPIFDAKGGSLFLSRFIFRGVVYKNIKLSTQFLEQFEQVVWFLIQNQIPFEIEKCHHIDHFYPIFVDKRVRVKPFGATSRVLICEPDPLMIEGALAFVKQYAPWAKTRLFLKDNQCRHDDAIFFHEQNVIMTLQEFEFNFAIIDIDPQTLLAFLKTHQTKDEIGLF